MTRQDILPTIAEIIRDVLDQQDLVIEAYTNATDVEAWDSFNHINIVVAIEARFGIRFVTAEIEQLKNVGELVSLVSEKIGAHRAI
jgi:acyl carrier protein